MVVNSVRILEDIEEALAREVRKITFFENRHRTHSGVIFRELFDPFTGELVKKPIEPQFYDETAEALQFTDPRFTIQLLKLYEDNETGRALSQYGEQFVTMLPSIPVYEPIFGGSGTSGAITTNGGTSNTVQITSRKILHLVPGNLIRLLTGNNKGTYVIESIALNGNGPHTITLDHNLLSDLPAFSYNPVTGAVTFSEFVDLTAIKVGDFLRDNLANSYAILAVDQNSSSVLIAANSNLQNVLISDIYRVGNILQGDDTGLPQCFLALDHTQLITDKSTRYRISNPPIPYTFLYYIKITSRERDDHIAIANRMMQVFNPPRGVINVIVRSNISAETTLIKDVNIGDKIIYVNNATEFYTSEKIWLMNNLSPNEELEIESVNLQSNAITLKSPATKQVLLKDCPVIVSNAVCEALQRDLTNHDVEDRLDAQLWIHRFTFKIEGWIDSKISPLSGDDTFKDVGDVNFIQGVIEDIETNVEFDADIFVP